MADFFYNSNLYNCEDSRALIKVAKELDTPRPAVTKSKLRMLGPILNCLWGKKSSPSNLTFLSCEFFLKGIAQTGKIDHNLVYCIALVADNS